MDLDTPQTLEQDPKIVLSTMATKMLADARSDRSFQNFLRIIIGESGRFPELAKAYVNSVVKPAMGVMTKYLESHPALELEDPEATVRVIAGTIAYFVMLQEMLYGKEIVPMDSDRVIKTMTDLIVAGD